MLACTQTDFRHLQRVESLQKKGKEKIKPECCSPFGIIAPFPSDTPLYHFPGSLPDWVSHFHLAHTGLPYLLENLGDMLQMTWFLCFKKKKRLRAGGLNPVFISRNHSHLSVGQILTLIRLLVICPLPLSHLRFTLHTFANS